jgi:hypothetical protein
MTFQQYPNVLKFTPTGARLIHGLGIVRIMFW